jgi:hypothetical protein
MWSRYISFTKISWYFICQQNGCVKQDFRVILIFLLNLLRFRLFIEPVPVFEDELGPSIIFSVYSDLSCPFVNILGLAVVVSCFPFFTCFRLTNHLSIFQFLEQCFLRLVFLQFLCFYRGADKSLAQPGWKQATATEVFVFFLSYL